MVSKSTGHAKFSYAPLSCARLLENSKFIAQSHLVFWYIWYIGRHLSSRKIILVLMQFLDSELNLLKSVSITKSYF
jgi:hypothetical protein